MSDRTFDGMVTAALAGALSLAVWAAPTAAAADEAVKCYGISKAGENSCANAAGTHSCAGQSTVDYDGGEYRVVGTGHCEELGGSLEPFEGVNEELANRPREG